MPVFHVFINGKKVGTTGLGEFGVMTAIVTWVRVRRSGERRSGALSLHLGGLDSSKPQPEHVVWANPKLKVGDEVRIRIAEAAKVDRPRRRKVDDPAADLRAQKRSVRMMAKKLGWKIQTR